MAERGLIFFDSNVLIAAALPEHDHHAASSARLATLQAGGGALAAHSLAETYNTLSRLSTYGIPPHDVLSIVHHAVKTYRVVTLTAAETIKTIEDAAARQLAGPIIYDSLLLACARKIDARIIYTSNTRHFRRIAPDLADRIREP
jgi:predicted nucleic acid-binding protein